MMLSTSVCAEPPVAPGLEHDARRVGTKDGACLSLRNTYLHLMHLVPVVQWPNEAGSNTHPHFFASHGSHAIFSTKSWMLPSGGSHSPQHLHQIIEALSTTVYYVDLQLLGVHKSWP